MKASRTVGYIRPWSAGGAGGIGGVGGVAWLVGLSLLGGVVGSGCALVGAGSVNEPELRSVGVETMPEPDPRSPRIDQLEVKAWRSDGAATNQYTVMLRGTIARPPGLDQGFGPTAWAVREVLDARGQPMSFTTEGYTTPDGLYQEPAAELYRRIGVSLGRQGGDRLGFAIHLRDLRYLTPKFARLALRAYALVPEGESHVDIAVPDAGQSVTLAGAWTLSVQPTVSDTQELVLQAIEAEPPIWPLEVDLLDEQGNLLSNGFRRGVETLGVTLATRWKFNQPEIAGQGRRLRVRLAQGLGVKQLDAELGNVQLIRIDRPEGPQ